MFVLWIRYKKPSHVRHMQKEKCWTQEVGYTRRSNGGDHRTTRHVYVREDETWAGGGDPKHSTVNLDGTTYNEIENTYVYRNLAQESTTK